MLGESGLTDSLTIKQYTYNGFGERTGATVNDKVAEYAYNPDGLRVSKTVNGETTTHILDGANVVADIQGTSISKYNRGRGLISIEQGGNKGYYVFNGHGDVLQIRNASGEQVYRKMYDAFGIEIESYDETNQFTNPFGYAGEYTDEETGNIYLRARYYNPSTGRFMSEDIHWNTRNMIYGDEDEATIPQLSAIIQSSNLYVYCGNDAVNRIDFSGNDWGYIRDFANDLGMALGSPDYDFFSKNVMISYGNTYGIFNYDGGIHLGNGQVAYRATNDNGKLYMDRVDFYKAMGVEYDVGSISYTVTAKGNAINSFITGYAVEYLFSAAFGGASGVASGVTSGLISYLYTQEPGDYIVHTTVASVYDPMGDWYDNVITYD